mmetsp:Transcript_40660/g.85418  ORF Transcript_40660/g.85418 Transcript_40660/m.85418 type:complete len:687 (+) Transcript_40660:318-2378(+)|eukprot:CAMPEP_0183727146 /NCGR_PEP_ID=MMETSP0737-20130205/24972_1 /TAXON_ID=385413 /ORGANISM="Thalassiosira miniscula, Strain CCMP1093" /LENGTH=686 /DNA_ID=CAMNT_0025958705 /DNA_START=232 /DNA_END=2292 /DNA_ORIENTATION=-
MAMEDPQFLRPIYENMSFNPFRSSSSSSHQSPPTRPLRQQQKTTADHDSISSNDNDSWHTNSGHPSRYISSSEEATLSSSPQRSSSAISWFAGWATSSVRRNSPKSKSPTTRAVSSSAILIQDDDRRDNHSQSMPSPLPSSSSRNPPIMSHQQTQAAQSMAMSRGLTETPESSQNSHQRIIHKDAISPSSVPHLPLQKKLSISASIDIGNGCIPSIAGNGSKVPKTLLQEFPQRNGLAVPRVPSLGTMDNVDTKNPSSHDEHAEMNGHDQEQLPSYPVPKDPPTSQTHSPSRAKNNEELLVGFPKPKTQKSSTPMTSLRTTPNTGSLFRHKQIFEESTFPGFALYQMAKARYSLGMYSQALDTTTECLALQKTSLLNGNKGGLGSAPAVGAEVAIYQAETNRAMPKSATTNASPHGSVRKGSGDGNEHMTPLDLRTTFVAGVGSSVLGVVNSMGSSSSRQQQHSPHPMLSNSIAHMVSQYPSHPCVAKTLLLRGRLLAICGLHGYGEEDDDERGGLVDFSLLVQSTQHVEMAIAIQRQVVFSDGEELASPLLFLGNMKSRLGHFDEADAAYNEAISILNEVRTAAKLDRLAAIEREDTEGASDCAQYLKRITGELVTALYLQGKSYHCQRKHTEAFDCYNRALNLLKKTSGSRGKVRVKRSIVRCMKKRHALEKLVSGYCDDIGVI